MILTLTVTITCNCFGQFDHDDFNDGSVIKNYRPYRPHTVVYNKERLLSNSCNFTVSHTLKPVYVVDNDVLKKSTPRVGSLSTWRDNPYSSLLGTSLQPNVNNLFLAVKAMHENKTIFQKKVSSSVKFTIKI